MTASYLIENPLISTNQSPLWNQSLEFGSYDIATVVESSFAACLCLMGLCGNLISIFIFTRPAMNSSINVLLTGISLIDIFVILLATVVFVIPSFDNVFRFEYVRRFYFVVILGVYPLALTAQTSSVWTFVLISVERYLAVCRPLEAARSLTPYRARLAQISVVLAAVSYNFVRFWEYKLAGQNDRRSDDKDQVEPNLRQNRLYLLLYFSASFQLTHFLVPFVAISTLNYFVLKTIKRASSERKRMSGSQSNQYRTSRMIIIVTAIFGLCNLPILALNFWEMLEPTLYDGRRAPAAYLLLDAANMAVLTNCGAHFVVYVTYCEKFRQLFQFYWAKCRGRAWKSATAQAVVEQAVALAQLNLPAASGRGCQEQLTNCLIVRSNEQKDGSYCKVSLLSDDPGAIQTTVFGPECDFLLKAK